MTVMKIIPYEMVLMAATRRNTTAGHSRSRRYPSAAVMAAAASDEKARTTVDSTANCVCTTRMLPGPTVACECLARPVDASCRAGAFLRSGGALYNRAHFGRPPSARLLD